MKQYHDIEDKSVKDNFQITKETIEVVAELADTLRAAGVTTITTDQGAINIEDWLNNMENI